MPHDSSGIARLANYPIVKAAMEAEMQKTDARVEARADDLCQQILALLGNQSTYQEAYLALDMALFCVRCQLIKEAVNK